MKKGARAMGLIFAFLIIAVLGLMAFVRLAPVHAAQWHVAQTDTDWAKTPWDAVVPETGAARLRLSAARGAPGDLLARLDRVALATPRTQRLAGSVAEGRVTYITRSALWGFPDYTTAEAREDGLYLHARLRFGRADMGVNAKRLQDWQAAL
ncbi:DUF1499 domain-containing protein [Pseudotabrizicola sediminis]|nr:DUF1499 domain-containing protein [Pseudotabrizicola sediminis]